MSNEIETATQIVDLVRAQNWKNGGVLSIDRDEAIGLVAQALRASFTEGCTAGARSTGDSMLRAFDAVAGR